MGFGETLGLGERHATSADVRAALDHHGIYGDDAKSYQWYVGMRDVMPLQTSGWGLGTERYQGWLLGSKDIRDIQIFPRLKGSVGGV